MEEVKAQHRVVVADDGELRRARGLGLKHIVERGHAHGGVEVVVHFLHELRAVLGANGLVHAALVLDVRNLRDELVVRGDRIVKVFPREDKTLAVVAL